LRAAAIEKIGNGGKLVNVFQDSNLSGFRVGGVYTLRTEATLQIIPRSQISYVGAAETTNPILLWLGIGLVVAALYIIVDPPFYVVIEFRPSDRTLVIAALVILSLIFFVSYFATKRVGISIVSSGGRMFIQEKGKNRVALLSAIYEDLARHHMRPVRDAWTTDAQNR
jgi:hypothetical protein